MKSFYSDADSGEEYAENLVAHGRYSREGLEIEHASMDFGEIQDQLDGVNNELVFGDMMNDVLEELVGKGNFSHRAYHFEEAVLVAEPEGDHSGEFYLYEID